MTHKFLIKPPFPQNEIVNSLLERCASYNFGVSLRKECQRLLRRINPSLDTVPCAIHEFCEAFGYAYGDEGAILHEHTLFNFYACGLDSARIEAFRHRLIGHSHGPIRPARLPLLFTPAEQECLHCQDCDEINLNKYGFIFTYRQHNAPFVVVCPWHGTRLIPGAARPRLYDVHCRLSGIGDGTLIRAYAVRTADCMESVWSASAYHRDEIWRRLVETRWLSEGNRCALNAFLQAFHKKFDKAFCDERLRHLCSKDEYVEAAIRAFVRADRNFHPVWCVLFRWFADETENARRSPKKTSASRPRQTLNHQTVADALLDFGSLRKAAQSLKVDVHTLSALALRYGLSINARPSRVHEPQRRQIEGHLRSGLSVADTAARCGVSVSTVYRVASANPSCLISQRQIRLDTRLETARRTWLEVQGQNKEQTSTELRRRHPAIWTYLYRHDRTWLEQHSARKARPQQRRCHSRAAGLVQLAQHAIGAAARECEGGEHAPVRRSRYRLQELTGFSEYAFANVIAISHVDSTLAADETRESFVSRRLHWVSHDLKNGVALKKWRLAKKAGLRASSIPVGEAGSSLLAAGGVLEVNDSNSTRNWSIFTEAANHEE